MKEDKENQIPPSIVLEFHKKPQSRPSTDRNSSLQGSGVKQSSTHDSLSLIEKKKQYSLAIRSKNMGRMKRDDSELAKSSGNILSQSKQQNNNN